MVTEEGIVVKLDKKTAIIRTSRKTACESCSEKHSCTSIGSGQEMELEADNPINAQVGDRVTVALKTGKLMTASFLLYIFPILMMIAGALLGDHLAKTYPSDPSMMAAGLGFLFFFVAFGLVKLKDMQAKKSGGFRPEIIRISKKVRP
ncbi:MAG: SoxR reducing system RseC family protein [Desulfobacterales bacterium]|jgi:sigma-E factor negative regulatory protein RseC|nr:SoxR reducing system RseC family protein [Desulfobacterales bacterium]